MKLIKRCQVCNKIIWHNAIQSAKIVGFPDCDSLTREQLKHAKLTEIKYYHFTKECYPEYDILKKFEKQSKEKEKK